MRGRRPVALVLALLALLVGVSPVWAGLPPALPAPASANPVSAAPAPGCPGIVDRTGMAMGTHIALRLCPGAASPAAVNAALDAALADVTRLEQLWSTWIPTSDISRLNAAAGAAVAISPETRDILDRALAGSRSSAGLFDVTFSPLGSLWTFDTPPGAHQPTRLARVPTVAEVEARRALVGWKGLTLARGADGRPTARLARAGMSVHLGGIGKGAAVDHMVRGLRAAGFRDFCVQAGGDLYCGGRNGARPWRVGIAHPRQPDALLGAVDIQDAAFSTSGDYERFAILDGRRYHHILDPRTGFPATASQSATVLAPSATDAEILTKAAFILGGDAALSALRRAGAQGVLVDAAGRRFVSPGLKVLAP